MIEKTAEIKPLEFNLAPFIMLYFAMIWLSLFPSVLFGYWFFITFPFSFNPLYLLALIPLFFVLYGIALLSSLFWTKTGVWIVHKRITPPIPGSYPLTMENPQTRAYVLKGNIKAIGRWLYYFFNLSFLNKFWLRQMGWEIGKKVRLGRINYMIFDDFVKVCDNVFISYNTLIAGHLMDQTHLTLNPTIIGKNTIFQNISGTVGATIGENSILTPITGVLKGQICRGNALYHGVPCKKIADNNLTPEEIKAIKQEIQRIEKIDHIKEKNAPIKISNTKLFLMKFVIVIGGFLFGLILPLLYALFFKSVYSPSNHLINILLLTLVPILFLCVLGFFIMGTSIFTKIFLVYYNRKGEIPEGYYELDDPKAKWFKIKYYLRLFGMRLFNGTPFNIVTTFALRFWGNIKLGKNVTIIDANIDPQYLEIGDYSQVAAGARIHTHDIIDGKLYIQKVKIGKHCIIGTYSHIKPGVEIADYSVAAIAAWFRKNRKCKRPALWLGKPCAEFPLSLLTKSARLEGKYVD